MSICWTPKTFLADASDERSIPEASSDTPISVDNDRWFWDFAPIVNSDGSVMTIGASEYWLALAAPQESDPSQRHFKARLALLRATGDRWVFLKYLLPVGLHPGGREWAGMALIEDGRLNVYFTSAGTSGESIPGYQQSLWHATATAQISDVGLDFVDWRPGKEFLKADRGPYLPADEPEGKPGFIRAFRDPFCCIEPSTSNRYVLFTATSATSNSEYNGAIGLAKYRDQSRSWTHLGPIVVSDGVTTEMERPHVVFVNESCYLFWSTQSYTFSDECSSPTALYGAVSRSIDTEFQLLNGSGLVAKNPKHAPHLCYSWFVTADLRVQGFIDLPRVPAGRYVGEPPANDEFFAGAAAPQFRLVLSEDSSSIRPILLD